jgi:hypothetical protein
MSGFLQAHGFDPGPTQRPALAGAAVGLLATLPATAILIAFGSLRVEAEILALPVPVVTVAGMVIMSVAGIAYGWLFRRAANDPRGGWLFGASFGFALWMAGAMFILPILGGGESPAGRAAIGIFLSLVIWGATLGALFAPIHRRFHKRASLIEVQEAGIGTSAAAGGNERPVR